MCYGTCPLENSFTGECRGTIDYTSPNATCRKEDLDVEPLAFGTRALFDHHHPCTLKSLVAGGDDAGTYLCQCGIRWNNIQSL